MSAASVEAPQSASWEPEEAILYYSTTTVEMPVWLMVYTRNNRSLRLLFMRAMQRQKKGYRSHSAKYIILHDQGKFRLGPTWGASDPNASFRVTRVYVHTHEILTTGLLQL